MKILTGHTSPETAYVVEDYPYGFRLRCRIRYWLEHKPRRGFRLVSQTTNPKKLGSPWNKPKASTYCQFGVMFLNEEDHVKWSGTSAAYTTAAELMKWAATWGEGLPEEHRKQLQRFINAKTAYEANRKDNDPLNVGLAEARKAFAESE